MPDIKFNFKGPVGAVVAVLVVGVMVYMEFFMPFYLTSRDKKAIQEKVESVRLFKQTNLVETTRKVYEGTGKIKDDSKAFNELSGEIKIIEMKGKKSFLSGIKVKVIYTIAEKPPKTDGGMLYFKLYRHTSKNSNVKRTELTQISKERYEKSLFNFSKGKKKS